MLGDGWLHRIPTKKGFSYRFCKDQEAHINGYYMIWLTNYFNLCSEHYYPHPLVITRGHRKINRLITFNFTSFGWIFYDFSQYNKVGDKLEYAAYICFCFFNKLPMHA